MTIDLEPLSVENVVRKRFRSWEDELFAEEPGGSEEPIPHINSPTDGGAFKAGSPNFLMTWFPDELMEDNITEQPEDEILEQGTYREISEGIVHSANSSLSSMNSSLNDQEILSPSLQGIKSARPFQSGFMVPLISLEDEQDGKLTPPPLTSEQMSGNPAHPLVSSSPNVTMVQRKAVNRRPRAYSASSASSTGSYRRKGHIPRPRGRAPKGREWDGEMGLWASTPLAPNGVRRPRGRAPSGKLWDRVNGFWVENGTD